MVELELDFAEEVGLLTGTGAGNACEWGTGLYINTLIWSLRNLKCTIPKRSSCSIVEGAPRMENLYGISYWVKTGETISSTNRNLRCDWETLNIQPGIVFGWFDCEESNEKAETNRAIRLEKIERKKNKTWHRLLYYQGIDYSANALSRGTLTIIAFLNVEKQDQLGFSVRVLWHCYWNSWYRTKPTVRPDDEHHCRRYPQTPGSTRNRRA